MPDADGPLTPDELAAWRGMLAVHAHVTRVLDAEMQAAHGPVGLGLRGAHVPRRCARPPDADVGDRRRRAPHPLGLHPPRRPARRAAATSSAPLADSDGRGLYAEITPEGLAVARAARRTHLAGVRREFLDRLSGEDQRRLGEIWARFGAG